jgi:hypothetical protein
MIPSPWRLPGSPGRPAVNVHLYEARGPHRLDSKIHDFAEEARHG